MNNETLTASTSDDEDADAGAALQAKLNDVMTPGFQVEFDPAEAEQMGAFIEDALSDEDAAASSADMTDRA